jgi:DNA-binding IclR family transcriptional regulator
MSYYVINGAPRIVKDELEQLLQEGGKPSLSVLAMRTGYTEQTVRSALLRLCDWGLVRYENRGPGRRCYYEVLE